MRVTLTKAARVHLAQIADYIRQDNPRAAISFSRLLQQRAREIGEFPFSHRVVAKIGGQEVRRRVVGNYLIFYVVEAEHVIIVDISHGARDNPATHDP